jgi:hypothetical protein
MVRIWQVALIFGVGILFFKFASEQKIFQDIIKQGQNARDRFKSKKVI